MSIINNTDYIFSPEEQNVIQKKCNWADIDDVYAEQESEDVFHFYSDEDLQDYVFSADFSRQNAHQIYDQRVKDSRILIGVRIKKLREEAGLSQADLAEKTGLKQQNIARIESGKYSTGQDILTKIAKALGKRLDIV